MDRPFYLCAMTDLHMTAKPGRIFRALSLARDADAVAITGDLTNDGTPEQFRRVRECIESALPGKPVFAVNGNHDMPTDAREYAEFQDWLFRRSGMNALQDASGAYSVCMGAMELIGLNVAAPGRRLTFEGGEQLDWLERRLNETRAPRCVILCHAPLLLSNPLREAGQGAPYFSRNDRLQRILDAHRNLIFLSGHTHISPLAMRECAKRDDSNGNWYFNLGSVCKPELKGAQEAPEWKDGNIVHLRIAEEETSAELELVHSHLRFPLQT